MDQLELGEKIQKLRKLKGLTQKELADKTSLSTRTIQRIENGEVDAKDILNYQISMTIYLIISAILVILIIGIPLLIFLGIFSSIVIVINTIKVLKGDEYKYPFNLNIIKNI